MKKTFSLFALLAAMGLVVVLAGCGKTNNTTSSNTTKPQPSTSDTSATSATQTPSQSQSQTQAAKAPVITVEPQTVEINAGEEVDLLFGVSATDEVDGRVNVIVLDDDDFDKDVPGTYVITYKAVNSKGKEATATRTIVVGQPLSQLALEVRENKLGEQKWTGKLINFAHELFVEVTANQEFTKRSGVFYNSSDAQVTISVEGGYGVSAILDKNGVVIEGRDGANGKLVNAQNPSRASSSVNTLDGETTVVSAFAQNMVIPAKGYAVVIQANYAGTTADSDGRGFMNYNVIYEYGNVVKLFWVDDNTVITPYANQAPRVSGNTEVNVFLNNTDNIEEVVKAGLVVKDDNNTFELSDDVEIETITIKSNGGYNAAVEGKYTFTLTATDGTLETEFTRVVAVIPNENAAVVAVGENEFTTLKDDIAIDQDLTSVGTYSFIVYTPTFIAQHEELGFENGWSEVFLLDQYGKIVLIYDGVNARKFTAAHHTLKPEVDTESCNAATSLSDAYADARTGGFYLLLASNSSKNNAAGGSRGFLVSNREYGAKVAITGVQFAEEEIAFSINSKSFSAAESLVIINEVTANAATYKMLIYTKACEAEAITCNGYGVAIILDKYGKLVCIYDGANGKLFDAENPSGVAANGWSAANYGLYAYTQLKEGETLIIFPNDGANAADSPRTFALGLRMDGSIGKLATLTGFTFEEEKPVNTNPNIKIGNNLFSEDGAAAIIINANGKVAENDFAIYSYGYAGRVVKNGWSVAIVIKDGKVVRIYDGANGKYYDAENTAGVAAGERFAAGTSTFDAFESLQPGELLVVGLNGGRNSAAGRVFALANRTIGADFSAPNVELPTPASNEVEIHPLVVDGDKYYLSSAILEDAKAVAQAPFIIYSHDYEGNVVSNGYGEAFVISAGKIVRIYDGANAKYYDAENTGGIQNAEKCTAAGYLAEAFASLQEGEYVLCAPNDGGANIARAFLLDHRLIGKEVLLPEFEEEPEPAILIGENGFVKEDIKIAYNDATATNTTHDFLVFTTEFVGSSALTNGYGEAFVIKDGKVVRIYDGANAKYYDAENTSGIQDQNKCTANDYFKMALASLQANEWLLVAPHDGGSNVARGFLTSNKVIGASVVINAIEVTPSENAAKVLGVNLNRFYNPSVLINAFGKPADYDFAIYSYGYTGRVIKNGYCDAFVIDMSNGKIVRVYDGVNGKYFDAENTGGVANTDSAYYTIASMSFDAFESLQPGEILVLGFNGGKNSNAGRTFMNANRTINASAFVAEISLPVPETETVEIKTVEVNGDKFYLTAAEVAYNNAAATHATHKFLIFTTEFSGASALTNGYGEAFVISGGKIVRIYDGANAKYYDAENTSGIQDNTKCTAADYFKMALASLQANEWLLVAPNDGGSNAARSFLLDNRSIGKDASTNAVEVTPSENALKYLAIGANKFYNPAVLVDGYGKPTNYDFAIYSYGYVGAVIKNGWCDGFVIDMSNGKVVRIYDGISNKYFDAENTGGIAGTDYFALATVSFDAFESLQPGEILVLGFNGGKNSNAGRTFMNANRTVNAQASASGVALPVPAAEAVAYKEVVVNGSKYYLTADDVAYNNAAATHATHKFLIFTTEFVGSSALANGYGEAFVISEGKVVRIYDGANAKYYDAENTGGIQDNAKCTAADYFKMALASLQANEWLLVAPNDGGNNIARAMMLDNRSIGKDVSTDAVTVTPSENAAKSLGIGLNRFYNPSLIINANGAVASNDFAVYSYGYAGRVVKNGWSVGIVINMSNGKVVRIYDSANGKYYDAENTAGVAAGEHFAAATSTFDAFESLQPGELLVVGLNGGKNTAAGRVFALANRTINAQASVSGIELPTPSAEAVEIHALVVDGDKYYLSSAILEDENIVSAAVPFLIYNYGYEGAAVSNGYGVAFVIKDNKIVRIYDGASAKYFDAENTGGIQDAEKCTAAGYLAEALASLQEGEYVLCAPNGGTNGNVARAFLYDHRSIGKTVELPAFE